MPSLVVGEITAVLFGRSIPGEFHWSICLPVTQSVAYKLHAKQVGEHWFFDPLPQHSLLTSASLAADIKIGQIGKKADIDTIYRLLKAIPMSTPAADAQIEPKFTCRV